MMRHRASSRPDENDDESSDEDDVFTAMSRKRKVEAKEIALKKSTTRDRMESEDSSFKEKEQIESKLASQKPVVVAQTSSTKRHHGEASDARKANLDAILLELEADTSKVASAAPHNRNRRSNSSSNTHQQLHIADSEQSHRAAGSYVDPGDELVTTNIFVGNLAPSITEEQMTELFRQFGDLYSVKVMWPRTPEERLRNRHTGFVCFMNRQDAEDAMDACNDQDPFRVGRQLMMRWGKNVRKRDGGVPIVYRGTGGVGSMPLSEDTDVSNKVVAAAMRSVWNQTNKKNEIHVVVPRDRDRAMLISTVASFVAKDGNQFEQLLLQNEGQNAHLSFLSMPNNHTTNVMVANEEFIFYKWRVYAFCQGDGFSSWRTEPFMMLQPNGCIWYPPPLDVDAAQREANEKKRKEDAIRSLKEGRRFHNSKRNILTGRQLEQQRKMGVDGVELSEEEMIEYNKLFKQELCISRESICQAMAFCFEKSNAAKQISLMIQELLMQLLPGISIETLSARIYLISDILYNSQQPGIRNAFLYRDAIERMSPDFFSALGDFVRTTFGRLSQERVASAVTQAFLAWSKWGVFDPTFINELSSRFEGRTIIHSEHNTEDVQEQDILSAESVDANLPETAVDEDRPKGDWTSVSVFTVNEPTKDEVHHNPKQNDLKNCLVEEATDADADGEPLDDDADGEPLDDDADGEPLDDDGEPLEDNSDGAPFEIMDEDPKCTVENSTIDGEPCDDDVDGDPL